MIHVLPAKQPREFCVRADFRGVGKIFHSPIASPCQPTNFSLPHVSIMSLCATRRSTLPGSSKPPDDRAITMLFSPRCTCSHVAIRVSKREVENCIYAEIRDFSTALEMTGGT